MSIPIKKPKNISSAAQVDPGIKDLAAAICERVLEII